MDSYDTIGGVMSSINPNDIHNDDSSMFNNMLVSLKHENCPNVHSHSGPDFSSSTLDESLGISGDFDLLQFAAENSDIKLEADCGLDQFIDELLVEEPSNTSGGVPMEALGSQSMDSALMNSQPQAIIANQPQMVQDNQMAQQINAVEQSPALASENVGSINVGQLTVDQLRQILLQTMPATPPPPVQQSNPTMRTLLLNPTPSTPNILPGSSRPQSINVAPNTATVSNSATTTVVLPTAASHRTTKAAAQRLPTVRVVSPTVTSPPPKTNVVSPTVPPTLQPLPGITSTPDSSSKVPIARCKPNHKPKERRSSHNVIEKRYRMSINDKIVELKDLVMGHETKLNKSAVLKKAIETIKSLREQRQRLSKENAIMNATLEKHGVNTKELLASCASLSEPLTPSSMSDNSTYSPETLLPDSPPYSACEDEMSNSSPPYTVESMYHTTGMVDGSRVILCMFMFAILLFNPFSSMLGSGNPLSSDFAGGASSGRTLQGYADGVSESRGLWNWLIPSALLWLINLIIIVGVLVKVLVYGEPVTTSGSKESTRYWRHMSQSDSDLENGFYSSAAVQLKEALHALGRPFPTTRLELVTSLLWQSLRQLLHRTYIARIFGHTAARRNKDVVKSSHHAAVAYYRLLQLSLTGKVESTGWQQLNLALCSLNLAEASSSMMARDLLAQVYAASAVTVLHTLTDHLHFIAKFLLSRCRKQCLRYDREQIPSHLRWLCEPAGHRYLVDLTWYDDLRCLEQGFSTNKHPYDPLSTLMQCYRQHLLQIALYEVITPKPDTNIEASLSYLEAIENTNPMEKVTDTPYELVERVDELAHWWSAVVAVGVHWAKSDYALAERYYHTLSSLPAVYAQSHDDEASQLPRAIHDIFRARSGLLTRTMCPYAATKLCNKASCVITENILATPNHGQHYMKQGFQMLACDWLLTTRTELWEQEADSAPGSVNAKDTATGFKNDLNNLQKLSDKHKGMCNKLAMYQATYRTMLGCNPSKTNHLLKTTLHNSPSALSYKLHNGGVSHLTTTSLMSRSDNKRQLLSEAAQNYDLNSETLPQVY